MRHFPSILLAAALLTGCRKPVKREISSPAPASNTELAAARFELAQEKIAHRDFKAALAQLDAALKADPANSQASGLRKKLLAETRWPVAVREIRFARPIEHLVLSGKNLFVSLAGEQNTLVRWNLEKQEIEAILFPTTGDSTRSLTLSPDGRFLVIERGGVTLLCNAETLKPIRDLPALPPQFTPSSVIAFSPNGLLFAHPVRVSEKDPAILWQIRDAATGELLRSSTRAPGSPLAASFDATQLRVFQADGSTLLIPISPVQPQHGAPSNGAPVSSPALTHNASEDTGAPSLLAAAYLPDGNLLALKDLGPHTPPEFIGAPSENLLTRFPWTAQPSLWSGILRLANTRILNVSENTLTLLTEQTAPIHTTTPITAAVLAPHQLIVGEKSGTVTFFDLTHGGESPVSETDLIVSAEKLAPLGKRLDLAKISDTNTPAKQLLTALLGDQPAAIQTALASAKNLPPFLLQLARTRIAWLENRKADALAPWNDEFPDLAKIRKREDWIGWEQADFNPAVDLVKSSVQQELDALKLPENATAEQRKQLTGHLTNPETIAIVGRRRLALASMEAALAFSPRMDENPATIRLSRLARTLGAPPVPCMRAEAMALNAMGNYAAAHPLWVSLITDFDLRDQKSSDFDEAAFAASQAGNHEQAIEILAVGVHRFPEDSDFILSAGWVALIAGNPQRAYEFLLAGNRVGYAPEKRENACAILAVAAKLSGSEAAANQYFQDLLHLNPGWAEAATIDALDWPEDHKVVLRQLAGL
ncbi:MAG: WD40 repeat domain-containing protein [Luteolibacter sp.]